MFCVDVNFEGARSGGVTNFFFWGGLTKYFLTGDVSKTFLGRVAIWGLADKKLGGGGIFLHEVKNDELTSHQSEILHSLIFTICISHKPLLFPSKCIQTFLSDVY